MDKEKGKKPIQEVDIASLLEEYQQNVSSSPLPPDFSPAFSASYGESGSGSGSGSGSANDSISLEELLDGEELEFFSKFMLMNFSELSNLEQFPVLPTSNPAPVPVVQADNAQMQVSSKTTVQPSTRGSGRKLQPFEFRKAMSPKVFADLTVADPKRAKRIMTNRMSAVRAKEKKKLYIFMLEHKVRTLQSETTALSTKFSSLEAETDCLTEENHKLKEHMEMVLQQIHLQEALNAEIRKEIHHLRTLNAKNYLNGRNMISLIASSGNNNHVIASSVNNNRAMNTTFATQQFPALQDQSAHQQQLWYGLQQQHQGIHPYQVQYSNQQQHLQQPYYQMQNEQVQPYHLQPQQQPACFEQLHMENNSAQHSIPPQGEKENM